MMNSLHRRALREALSTSMHAVLSRCSSFADAAFQWSFLGLPFERVNGSLSKGLFVKKEIKLGPNNTLRKV